MLLGKITQNTALKALKISQNTGTLRATLTLFLGRKGGGGGGGNYVLKICFYIGVSFEKMINVYSFALNTYTSKLTISG